MFTEQHYKIMQTFRYGADYVFHIDEDMDKSMRYLMEKDIIVPDCTKGPNYYELSDLGKAVLENYQKNHKIQNNSRPKKNGQLLDKCVSSLAKFLGLLETIFDLLKRF